MLRYKERDVYRIGLGDYGVRRLVAAFDLKGDK